MMPAGYITTTTTADGTVCVMAHRANRKIGLTLGELARFVDHARDNGFGDETEIRATKRRRGQLTGLRTRYTP